MDSYIRRKITYQINKEFFGWKISRYLKYNGYPEHALTKLRQKEGVLKVNSETVHMNYIFEKESLLEVSIVEDEASEKIEPVSMNLDIVYEDDDLIVVNKPSDMPIHPSLNNYDNTLANGLSFYFKSKGEPFVFRCINRLDRDTSGLTIVAKNYLSAGILSQAMLDRAIKREYTALVMKKEGAIPLSESGRIDKPIGRKDDSTTERVIDYQRGKKAITNYRVIGEADVEGKTVFKVKCVLETGRTHQIRVHMTSIGYPLLGDFLYNPGDTSMKRQALHAGSISFVHPITQENMYFEVAPPEDFIF